MRRDNPGRGMQFAVLIALWVLLTCSQITFPQESQLLDNTQRQKVVDCKTTKGNFRVNLHPDLAPNGTQFLWEMVGVGYFNQPKEKVAFWRVNDKITQFGITKMRKQDQDPFVKWRKGANRDENPFGGVGNDDKSVAIRKSKPWPRGTFASIGGHHFLVVMKQGRNIGVSRHDAPLGTISETDMANVFDKLYKYNDIIDHKNSGPGVDQTVLMHKGIEYIEKDFPLTDLIISCEQAYI